MVDGRPDWGVGFSVINFTTPREGMHFVGKIATVANSISDDGDYNIIAHNNTLVTVDHVFTGGDAGSDVTIHDAAGPYLTRTPPDFETFIL